MSCRHCYEECPECHREPRTGLLWLVVLAAILFCVGAMDMADEHRRGVVHDNKEAHGIVWDAEANVYLYTEVKK